MIPKRVTLENFLSYGPRTEIAFTDDEPLWVLGGPNGVGKSAVFDAITYCLFAEHRGGATGHEQLTRHGANGFAVSFEFEFAGTDYRITRTRSGKKTTQPVERLVGGAWARVPDVDGVADVKGWVERTIGLSHAAFTASVLLPQGKADEMLTAPAGERLELLKKVIGVERFEALGRRVEAARKGKDAALRHLQQQRAGLAAVTAEEVAAAEAEVGEAAAVRESADIARRDAAAAVHLARQWVGLCARRDDLTRRLVAAAAREAEADAIRANRARLVELSAVVPLLQELGPLRASTAAGAAELDAARAGQTRAAELRAELRNRCEGLRLRAAVSRDAAGERAREAARTREQMARLEPFLVVADDVAAMAAALAAGRDLDAELAVAVGRHAAVADRHRAATVAETQAATLLEQAEAERRRFAEVETGVPCSRCGQPVTAEHAEAERRRTADAVAELTSRRDRARLDALGSAAEVDECRQAREEVEARIGERTRLQDRHATRRASLEELGGTADPAALRAEVARLSAEAEGHEFFRDEHRARQAADEASLAVSEAELATVAAEEARLAKRIGELERGLAADTATRDSLIARLPVAWVGVTDPAPDAAELERLAAAGVEDLFRKLEQDAARRGEWERERGLVVAEIDTLPGDGRLPVPDAERRARAADEEFRGRDGDHRAAAARRDDLTRRRIQFEELTAQAVAAEGEARVHARLDTLLGKQKLQRELIREAEAQIVRLANQTVGQLSGGELSIALAQSEEGDDKAFDLLVRRGDDPVPIGVRMLSGSQKFRVAISVALAIGRFASGQARPLECVIIDEGFGSLDKEGLRAAAEELNRLKDHLKRIILVSHQEEFTDQFPVVIRLSKGEHGTTAEQIRRRQ